MDIKLIRRANLKDLIRGYTEEGKIVDFAEVTGLDPGQMSTVLNGHRNIGEKLARRIEAAAGLPIGTLDTFHKDAQSIQEKASTYQIKRVNRVPVISWEEASEWAANIAEFHPGNMVHWLETTQEVSAKTFALAVDGQSLYNPAANPSIPDGALVTVDPELVPRHGNIVVAQLQGSGEPVLKKLIIDGPNRYLEPLNAKYEAIKIDNSWVIVGVVTKVEFEL